MGLVTGDVVLPMGVAAGVSWDVGALAFWRLFCVSRVTEAGEGERARFGILKAPVVMPIKMSKSGLLKSWRKRRRDFMTLGAGRSRSAISRVW